MSCGDLRLLNLGSNQGRHHVLLEGSCRQQLEKCVERFCIAAGEASKHAGLGGFAHGRMPIARTSVQA